MKMPASIDPRMIAPCGMNCAVCYVHLRDKKPCQGCLGADVHKPNHCRACKIKACADEKGVAYCFACADFPCPTIKRMDKSYRARYQVSLIDYGRAIKVDGMEAFLAAQVAQWTCPHCGGAISLHDRVCSDCHVPTPERPSPSA